MHYQLVWRGVVFFLFVSQAEHPVAAVSRSANIIELRII
jgi:hypothetical protein